MPEFNIRIRRKQLSVWVIAAIIVLILSGVYSLFLRRAPKTKDDNLLKEIQSYFISLEEYCFKTVEEGPGYRLVFEGLSRHNCLTGEIVGRNLHILYQNGFLFIKDDNGRWEKAADLGLDNLKAFIKKPFSLITGIREKVPLVRFKNEAISGEKYIYTASIEANKEELAAFLFPGIGTDLINSVMLSVAIESEKVKEINILLEMKQNGESELSTLTRKIIIEADAVEKNKLADTII